MAERRDAALVAAVDVGTSKVLAAVAVPEDQGLRVLGVARVVAAGVRRGAVVDLAAAAAAIATAAERARRVAGRPLPEVTLGSAAGNFLAGNREAEVPVEPPAEVAAPHVRAALAAVGAAPCPEGYRLVHAIAREFLVDGYEGARPEGIAASRLGVRAHVVACEATLLQNLYRAAASAGIGVQDFAVAALASAEAVLTSEERRDGALLLDLGAGATQWAAVQGGEPVASGSVATGGSHVTADIAAGLGVDLPTAEGVKYEHADLGADPASTETLPWLAALRPGGSGPEPTAGAFAEIVRARVEETLESVAAALREGELQGRLPAGAVLTGGASRLRGLPALAMRVLGLPVRCGGAVGASGTLGGPECAALVGLLQFAAQRRTGGRRLPPLPAAGRRWQPWARGR